MSYEIEKILQNAEDCLLNAEYNFKGNWYKAAANRAYYCIFDCISALLQEKQVTAKTHQGAHIQFRQLYIKTGVLDLSLAEMLSESFELRQSADYDFEFDLSEADAASAINNARTFFTATKNYFEPKNGTNT